MRRQHLLLDLPLFTGHRRDLLDRTVGVATFVTTLKELVKAHRVEQAINARVGTENGRAKVKSLLGLNRQLREHAQGGAVEPVGLGDIHPHADKVRLGKHRLKVLIERRAHGEAHIPL